MTAVISSGEYNFKFWFHRTFEQVCKSEFEIIMLSFANPGASPSFSVIKIGQLIKSVRSFGIGAAGGIIDCLKDLLLCEVMGFSGQVFYVVFKKCRNALSVFIIQTPGEKISSRIAEKINKDGVAQYRLRTIPHPAFRHFFVRRK